MEIYFTNGCTAQIDERDRLRVSKLCWHLHVSKRRGKPTNYYARATIGGWKVYLHRFIMNCPNGMEVDHLDGDGLNCRRSNLEIVAPIINKQRRDTRAKLSPIVDS